MKKTTSIMALMFATPCLYVYLKQFLLRLTFLSLAFIIYLAIIRTKPIFVSIIVVIHFAFLDCYYVSSLERIVHKVMCILCQCPIVVIRHFQIDTMQVSCTSQLVYYIMEGGPFGSVSIFNGCSHFIIPLMIYI